LHQVGTSPYLKYDINEELFYPDSLM